MDQLISALLVINPFIAGLYSLLDYIGYIYDNITIRIAYTHANIFVSVIYLLLYVYLIHYMLTHNVTKGFKHNMGTKLIFSVISSIVLLSIFFLQYYSFKSVHNTYKRVKKLKKNQDSLLLINLEKTEILVAFLYVLYFAYDCVQSSKQFLKGDTVTSMQLNSVYYSFGFLASLLILKLFELNTLIKEDKRRQQKENITKSHMVLNGSKSPTKKKITK